METRSEDAFEANQRLAERAAALHFVSRVPMFCECSDPACLALVLIDLDRYGEVRSDPSLCLTAPEHRVDGATPLVQKADFWLYRTRG